MSAPIPPTRRRLLATAALASPALLLGAAPGENPKKEEVEVTPGEDLMREHGVLKRVLLVYDEARWRLSSNAALPLDALGDASGIIRTFIEGYHEKLEEEHLFPRFRRHRLLVPLVETLARQHAAGRKLTAQILEAVAAKPKADLERQALAAKLAQFVRMYAPHEAREDTVLFPAIRKVVSPPEYDALGEEFERKERQLLGKSGFEGMVAKIAEVEKKFDLYDLDKFTPH